ncbi:hypothetical protein EB001_10350 [bacterium]|nr:hypothetical protein [bacterium]
MLTIFLIFLFLFLASYTLTKNSDFWYNGSMPFEHCQHVYRNVGQNPCQYCGGDSHETDWKKENKLRQQWLKENPLAYKEVGWWSI